MSAAWKTLAAVVSVLTLASPAGPSEALRYPSPVELIISSDGRRLYVVCEGTDEVVVVDVASGKTTRRIPVGRVPKGASLSADGRQLFVANSWSDNVSVIDTSSLEVVRALPAGFEPTSVITDSAGAYAYVANRVGNDVSVVDVEAGQEVKRLVAGRGASYLALSTDGRRIYVTPIFSNIGPYRTPPQSEITVIDTGRQVVVERKTVHNVAGMHHIAVSPDGRLGLAAQIRPKNLIPMTQLARGFVFVNSLAVFAEEWEEVIQLPIDELDRYFSLPFGVVFSADGRLAWVSTSGSNSVTVVDIGRLLEVIRSSSRAERHALANDLSASARYVAGRIPVGRNPKGLVLSPDGGRLFVANRLDDTVSIIDTVARRVVGQIPMGGPSTLTAERRGEQNFFNARFSFQGQFSCGNCHLEATIDGLAWDLEPDGLGKDIVDNRLLEQVGEIAPYKWNGGNPDIETECGPRTSMFIFRAQGFSPSELGDLVRFIKSIPLRPNRFRLPNGELTEAQERGEAIFKRTRRKDGTPIAENLQCSFCHSGPYGTNRQMTDVKSGTKYDRSSLFDTPQLTNIALTAPYLHDGSARTLEEIWTVFNPDDTHGVTNDLAKDELNDLIEYLKTL